MNNRPQKLTFLEPMPTMKAAPVNVDLEETLKRVYDEIFNFADDSKSKATLVSQSDDESDDDDTDDDDSLLEWQAENSEEDAEETRLVQQMVSAAFSRTKSAASLSEPRPTKRRRVETAPTRMDMVASAPCLRIMQELPAQMPSAVCPDDHLRSMLRHKGFDAATVPALDLTSSYFSSPESQSVAGYDMEMVKAVREQDVDALRRIQAAGHPLQCSNKFGESIVHTTCRRGADKVLDFLMSQGVDVKVCCDYGRTPLHDACWTCSPNFTVVGKLIEACPDMLHMTDKRGFTPLTYVPKDQWADWCSFLTDLGAAKLAKKEL